MENNKIERIQKSAGTTAKILGVIKTILIVGLVLAILGGFSTAFFRLGDDGTSLTLFNKTITVHNFVNVGDMNVKGFAVLDAFDIKDPFLYAGVNCFYAAFLIALTLTAIIILRNAFVAVEKSDTPFTEDILKKIKIAGIIVTVITLTSSIGTAAIVGLTFWCVYCIFDYGTVLQKESDETL